MIKPWKKLVCLWGRDIPLYAHLSFLLWLISPTSFSIYSPSLLLPFSQWEPLWQRGGLQNVSPSPTSLLLDTYQASNCEMGQSQDEQEMLSEQIVSQQSGKAAWLLAYCPEAQRWTGVGKQERWCQSGWLVEVISLGHLGHMPLVSSSKVGHTFKTAA